MSIKDSWKCQPIHSHRWLKGGMIQILCQVNGVSSSRGHGKSILDTRFYVRKMITVAEDHMQPGNNNNNKLLYSACSAECAHGRFTVNYYYYPWSIGLETILYHHSPSVEHTSLLPIWRWWSYSTIQYPSLPDQVAHVSEVAGLRSQETAVSWARTPAVRVTVEQSAAGLPIREI